VTGLARLLPDSLTDEQRVLYEAVLASPRAQGAGRQYVIGDDGSLRGPFDLWLRSPSIGGLLERLGMALRDQSALSAEAREICVLVVARAWDNAFEWEIHRMLALLAGVSEAAVEAIATDRTPIFADAAQTAAFEVATELLRTRTLGAHNLDRAVEAVGERGLVEIVVTVGFYQLVSGTLAIRATTDRPDSGSA
jgi:4-carboxymuconolactone decarboxylase